MRPLRYVSVCSGIEAATVAWHPLGWVPLMFAEIAKFPSRVLAHHYPQVPNAGDFATIRDVSGVDLLVGGTPCQSFSLAGLRGGLADDRGNLALEFMRLADRLRPRWLLWENVPGVLSSNGGRDFGSILGALGELGYGFAYRILDAQFFGVPQRRRRVFVVGYLGDWRRAAAVLFERESLRGDSQALRVARDSAPRSVVALSQNSRDEVRTSDVMPALTGGGGKPGQGYPAVAFHATQDPISGPLAPALGANGANGVYVPPVSYALTCHAAKMGDPTTDNYVSPSSGRVRKLTPRECERLQGFPTCIDRVIVELCGDPRSGSVGVALKCLRSPSNALPADEGGSGALALSADATLWSDQASKESVAALSVRLGCEPKVVAVRSLGKLLWLANGAAPSERFPRATPLAVSVLDIAAHALFLVQATQDGRAASPLSIKSSTPPESGSWRAVTYGHGNAAGVSAAGSELTEATRSTTLKHGQDTHCSDLTAETSLSFVLNVMTSCIPRATPAENFCRFIIDLEQDYTMIPGASDSARYRALGNSMAVPCMAWIGKRISQVEAI